MDDGNLSQLESFLKHTINYWRNLSNRQPTIVRECDAHDRSRLFSIERWQQHVTEWETQALPFYQG